MKKTGQMSESRRLAFLLAASGGLMDAYTYLFRGKVFANAQTGNLLLFGVRLSEGNMPEAFKYLFPVLAFAGGIVLAELVQHFFKEGRKVHWRQLTVLLECMVLFAVGFMPGSFDPTANAMVSFACGIQVESFRKVQGNGAATTMCIGNLRSGTQAVCDYFFTGDKSCLTRGFTYYGIILIFVLGAVAGNLAVKFLQERAVWCSCVLLLLGWILMFRGEEHN